MEKISEIHTRILKWADKMEKERAKKCNRFLISTAGKNVTYCVDLRTGKSGLARCRPSDAYNSIVGKAVAYARCRGYDIPEWTIYKTMEEMTNGEKFRFNEKIYTFIGYLGRVNNSSDIKTYVISENNNDVTRFMSFPYERYEMVE